MIATDKLALAGAGKDGNGWPPDDVGVIEAVVGSDSALSGRTAGRLLMRAR